MQSHTSSIITNHLPFPCRMPRTPSYPPPPPLSGTLAPPQPAGRTGRGPTQTPSSRAAAPPQLAGWAARRPNEIHDDDHQRKRRGTGSTPRDSKETWGGWWGAGVKGNSWGSHKSHISLNIKGTCILLDVGWSGSLHVGATDGPSARATGGTCGASGGPSTRTCPRAAAPAAGRHLSSHPTPISGVGGEPSECQWRGIP